jgi:hypothetical protein
MLQFKTVSTLLATAAIVSLAPVAGAEAALLAGNPLCSISNVTGAVACAGSFAGNDSNQKADVLDQLVSSFGSFTGIGEWSHDLDSDKSDGSGNGPFTSNPEVTNGTLTFDTPQTGFFAIALKAGPRFSLYLLDGGTTGISSFNFDTIGTSTNPRGMAQDLSHASLYHFDGEDTEPIPTPALLPGLIGLGIAGLRQRNDKPEEATDA